MIRAKDVERGHEFSEWYWSEVLGVHCLEYNFRAADGELFTTIVKGSDAAGAQGDAKFVARSRRDNWLASRVPAPVGTRIEQRY